MGCKKAEKVLRLFPVKYCTSQEFYEAAFDDLPRPKRSAGITLNLFMNSVISASKATPAVIANASN